MAISLLEGSGKQEISIKKGAHKSALFSASAQELDARVASLQQSSLEGGSIAQYVSVVREYRKFCGEQRKNMTGTRPEFPIYADELKRFLSCCNSTSAVDGAVAALKKASKAVGAPWICPDNVATDIKAGLG